MWRFKQFITEEVYGWNATVYHRTKSEGIIDLINKEGFKPGHGDMYGEGIYSTYDLKSQLNQRMIRVYGDFIVKASINLHGYLIFDYEVSKLLYGEKYRLHDQLQTFSPNLLDYRKDYGVYFHHDILFFLKQYKLGLESGSYFSQEKVEPPFENFSNDEYSQDRIKWLVHRIIADEITQLIKSISEEHPNMSVYLFKNFLKRLTMPQYILNLYLKKHPEMRLIGNKIGPALIEITNKVASDLNYQLRGRHDFNKLDDKTPSKTNLLPFFQQLSKGIEQGGQKAKAIEHLIKTYPHFLHSLNGIVYTGQSDGRVAITYKPNTITPLGFAEYGANKLPSSGRRWFEGEPKKYLDQQITFKPINREQLRNLTAMRHKVMQSNV